MVFANKGARIALVALEVLMGLAAVGGGLDLVLTNGQVIRMPAGLLEGSPFGSYFIPGLVLLAVGMANLASAAAVLVRNRWGAPASVVVGITWMGVRGAGGRRRLLELATIRLLRGRGADRSPGREVVEDRTIGMTPVGVPQLYSPKCLEKRFGK